MSVAFVIAMCTFAMCTLGWIVRGRHASADGSTAHRELLRLALGDHGKVERLIAFERARDPAASCAHLIRRAIDRWRQDNR